MKTIALSQSSELQPILMGTIVIHIVNIFYILCMCMMAACMSVYLRLSLCVLCMRVSACMKVYECLCVSVSLYVC